MTDTDFLLFYPQFSAIPTPVLQETVREANARFESFQEDTELARRLFTAHRLTLYARSSTSSAASTAALSSAGSSQTVSSKHVGEVSVSYASPQVSANSTDLTLTLYGLQLLPLLKLHGLPVYVP